MKLPILSHNISDCFNRHGLEISGVFDFSFLYTETTSPLNSDFSKYQDWIRKNWHADMGFMEKNLVARKDAREILENVKSGIIFLIPYSTGERIRKSNFDNANSLKVQSTDSDFLKSIAKYARGRDYHKVVKAAGEKSIADLQKIVKTSFEARTVVDSVPFFERAHAKQSGLGFIGKNTMLIRPGVGSFFFIATILTTLSVSELCDELQEDDLMQNLNCGSCRLCIDACPTNALTEYSLNANRCLSYLTIEHREKIADEFLPHFKDIFFGCDICQTACPYNFSTVNALRIDDLATAQKQLIQLTHEHVATMTHSPYEAWFGGTSLTRAKYSGLVRNALYALWANKSKTLSKILISREQDPEPVIRDVVAQLKNL